MFSRFATSLLSAARGFGQLTGNELDVIVSDHKINIKMINPDKSDEYGRAWDDSQYVKGNIHHEQYANPVKVSIDEDSEEVDVIVSQRYKKYMENKLMNDIISETADDSSISMFTAVLILGTIQILTTSLLLIILVM